MSFSGSLRRNIAKANKQKFIIGINDNKNSLNHLYQIHKQNMINIGGIIKPKKFFNLVHKTLSFNKDYRIYYAYDDDKIIACLLIFYFKDNQKLIYNDIRKFGFIKLFDLSNTQEISHLKSLGPEPLEKKFNSKYLKEYFFGRNRTIKDILMDQKCVSGLGNIYVNEILFLCGIRPSRKTKAIKNFEINKMIITLTKNILKILNI